MDFQYHQFQVEKDRKITGLKYLPPLQLVTKVNMFTPPHCPIAPGFNITSEKEVGIWWISPKWKNNVSAAVLQLLPSPIFEGENKMNSLHRTPHFVQSRPEGESSWNSTGVTAKLFYLFLNLLLNHLLLALHLAFFLAVQHETFPQAKSPPHIGEVSCTPPSSTNLQYIYALPLL